MRHKAIREYEMHMHSHKKYYKNTRIHKNYVKYWKIFNTKRYTKLKILKSAEQMLYIKYSKIIIGIVDHLK